VLEDIKGCKNCSELVSYIKESGSGVMGFVFQKESEDMQPLNHLMVN
jgi:hypothetical protein